MTVRDGALKFITQQIVKVNQYQIEENFATELAEQIIDAIKITGNKCKKLKKPAVYIRNSEEALEVKTFDSVADAVLFAQSLANEAGVVWQDQVIDWAPLGKKVLYKDTETGKIAVAS